MTEDFNEIKPGAQAVAESVTRKRAALEAKHIILTDRPEDVAAYLPKYHHTMHEIIEIGPWQSYGAFREGAGRNMTRLFLSDEARAACAEELSRLTDVQKRASYLFSYEEAADWIHENVESEVMSVLVPLSMFATDPDAFRSQFLEERSKACWIRPCNALSLTLCVVVFLPATQLGLNGCRQDSRQTPL